MIQSTLRKRFRKIISWAFPFGRRANAFPNAAAEGSGSSLQVLGLRPAGFPLRSLTRFREDFGSDNFDAALLPLLLRKPAPRTSSTLLRHASPRSHPSLSARMHNLAAPWVILQLLFLDEQKGIGAVVQPHPSARTMPLLRAGTTGPAADRAGA